MKSTQLRIHVFLQMMNDRHWWIFLHINCGQCHLRAPKPIQPIVTAARNSVVKQTGVNNANLIILTSSESRSGSTTAPSCSDRSLTSAVTCVLVNTRSVCNKPVTVKEHMIDQPRERDGRLRQNYAPTLHQGITKKCIGDSAFGAAAPRVWNELPVNIRASGTLSMFKKCLKMHLFIRHFN